MTSNFRRRSKLLFFLSFFPFFFNATGTLKYRDRSIIPSSSEGARRAPYVFLSNSLDTIILAGAANLKGLYTAVQPRIHNRVSDPSVLFERMRRPCVAGAGLGPWMN